MTINSPNFSSFKTQVICKPFEKYKASEYIYLANLPQQSLTTLHEHPLKLYTGNKKWKCKETSCENSKLNGNIGYKCTKGKHFELCKHCYAKFITPKCQIDIVKEITIPGVDKMVLEFDPTKTCANEAADENVAYIKLYTDSSCKHSIGEKYIGGLNDDCWKKNSY